MRLIAIVLGQIYPEKKQAGQTKTQRVSCEEKRSTRSVTELNSVHKERKGLKKSLGLNGIKERWPQGETHLAQLPTCETELKEHLSSEGKLRQL